MIGVEDAGKEVTGIEPDLESKGREPSDLDFYEQELTALIDNCIDAAAHSQIRIRFQQHESGTTCHVNVRNSPSPRFGRAPAGATKGRPVFWIRANNTTRRTLGADLYRYMFEHWQ